MKKIMRHACLTGLLAVALAVPAFAGEAAAGAKPEADGELRFEATANRLNLSAEQREQLKALRQNQRQQMTELRRELQEARALFKEALDDPAASRDSIAPMTAEVKAILAKMVDHRVEAVFAAKSILTPDQFSRLQQFQPKRQEGRKSCRPFWMDIKLKRDNAREKTTGAEGQ